MNVVSRAILLSIIATGGFNLRADAQNINSVLAQWQVVTSGNLDMVNDIQGSAFVGGNVTVPNSFNVQTGNTGIPMNNVSFAVGGNVDNGGNIQVNGGSVVVGGAIEDMRTFNMNSGGSVHQGNPSLLPPSPVSQINANSQYWSTLTANSSTFVANNGQLDFNCSASAPLSVFNINANVMFNSGYQGFTLVPANGVSSDVIINISGANVNWQTGGFFSQFNTPYWDGHVLFNFYNATTVNLSGQIGGYVVAPNASVMEGNNIDGGVMAENLTVDSEVDLPSGSTTAWSGDLPNAPIPEVSTFIPGMSALVMFGIIACREKRKARALMTPRGGVRP